MKGTQFFFKICNKDDGQGLLQCAPLDTLVIENLSHLRCDYLVHIQIKTIVICINLRFKF